jgi:sensor histidine kinase YesM
MELEKTVAELNMLKLQISPHFLFNTLNNIRWLVRKSHPIRKTLLLNFRKYFDILFMK